MSKKLVEKTEAVMASYLVFKEHTGDQRQNLRILGDILKLILQLSKLSLNISL